MKMNRKQALRSMAWATTGVMGLPRFSAAGDVGRSYAREAGPQEQDRGAFWRNAALVIVDMQNDFVRVGAPLEVPDARKTIGAHQQLLEAFRKRNLPVVYTKFISRPHYYILWDWSPQCAPPTRCCWKDHERYYSDIAAGRQCTEIIDELKPDASDVIVEKYGYGAFHETGLDRIIRSFGFNSVVITGTVTQICVEETAREAFHHGFRTTIVTDAVSSFAPDLHAATLKNFAMKFGWTASTGDIVAKLA